MLNCNSSPSYQNDPRRSRRLTTLRALHFCLTLLRILQSSRLATTFSWQSTAPSISSKLSNSLTYATIHFWERCSIFQTTYCRVSSRWAILALTSTQAICCTLLLWKMWQSVMEKPIKQRFLSMPVYSQGYLNSSSQLTLTMLLLHSTKGPPAQQTFCC